MECPCLINIPSLAYSPPSLSTPSLLLPPLYTVNYSGLRILHSYEPYRCEERNEFDLFRNSMRYLLVLSYTR